MHLLIFMRVLIYLHESHSTFKPGLKYLYRKYNVHIMTKT